MENTLSVNDLKAIGFKHIGGKMVRDIGQEFILNNGRYFVHLTYTRFTNKCVLKIQTSVSENSKKTLVVHSIGIRSLPELLTLFEQLNIL